MDAESSLATTHATQARSLSLIIWMATVTPALRIAIWAANTVILWRLYGRATVAHEHLRITRIKPQLVVSNGDVLRGIGPYHYFLGIAIWLPLAVSLLVLIYYKLWPRQLREAWQGKEQREQTVSVFALLWALALFFLVVGLSPMAPALALAITSVVIALIWARRIQYGRN